MGSSRYIVRQLACCVLVQWLARMDSGWPVSGCRPDSRLFEVDRSDCQSLRATNKDGVKWTKPQAWSRRGDGAKGTVAAITKKLLAGMNTRRRALAFKHLRTAHPLHCWIRRLKYHHPRTRLPSPPHTIHHDDQTDSWRGEDGP
jgi:hypothetical protein